MLPGALVGLERVAWVLASVQASTAHLINKLSPAFTTPWSPEPPMAACEDKGCVFVQGNEHQNYHVGVEDVALCSFHGNDHLILPHCWLSGPDPGF